MCLNYIRKYIADIRNPKDIYASQRPLIVACYFAALCPFKVVGPVGNRHMEVCFAGVLNTITHLCLFCICYFFQIRKLQSFIGYFFNTEISRFAHSIQSITLFVGVLVTVSMSFLKRDKFKNVFHLLSKIDRKLISLGAKVDYKAICRFILAILVLKWCIYTIFLGASYYLLRLSKTLPDFSDWILLFSPYVYITTTKIKFIFIVRQIKNRFHYINHLLNNIRTNQSDLSPFRGCMDEVKINSVYGITCEVPYNQSKRKNHEIISELCRTHEELCDACYLTEQYFNHQMLTIVAIEFVITLFNIYYILEVAFKDNCNILNIGAVEFISFFTFYTFLSFGSICGIVKNATAVTREVEI